MTIQLPEMYSAEQFHCMFPAVDVTLRTWHYWLEKWRTSKPPKLVRNIHWMYIMTGDKRNIPVQVYLPKPVLKCILDDPSACYFTSQFDGVYGNKIRLFLSGTETVATFVDNSPHSV